MPLKKDKRTRDLATPDSYQAWLRQSLEVILGVPVIKGWYASLGAGTYSPRVDVAVGPFAIEDKLGGDYDRLVERFTRFLRALHEAHRDNVDRFDSSDPAAPFETLTSANWNARCFLAIEVENANSRKHLMGSAINAAALGRIGLAVGWGEDRVIRFLRMRRYLSALRLLRKKTFDTSNLLVLSSDQLAAAVTIEARRRRRILSV